ncbi:MULTISPECIES: 30S ribosomal protein S6 [Spirulina sp. CCY15215]|uniref:30S ribosomal protein S6 n=1 Tax=Spirulina sp. CCY15215 TaxID=2767591 RepID=UPI001EF2FE72|nr:30S ribosomal protein S6 [Spirulina major]
MSRSYEMMFVLRPDLSEERMRETIDKYKQMLGDYGSTEIKVQVLGKRRLAYPIKRFQDGTFVLVTYQSQGEQVAPVEKAMGFSEEVIRYLTIKLSDRKDKSKVEEEKEAEPVAAEV